MNYWLTADYHLGHANIIKYSKRPFKDVYHMNNAIIKNHNERVKPDDTVFFIGDFCFKNTLGGKEGEGELQNAEYYLKKLNGRFVFIQGNHDSHNSLKTVIQNAVIILGGKEIFLVHNPEHFNKSYRFNFVGHVHERWKYKIIKGISLINVGVDVWNFRPVSINEIFKEYQLWRQMSRLNK